MEIIRYGISQSFVLVKVKKRKIKQAIKTWDGKLNFGTNHINNLPQQKWNIPLWLKSKKCFRLFDKFNSTTFLRYQKKQQQTNKQTLISKQKEETATAIWLCYQRNV